jgi:hypothetical protein
MGAAPRRHAACVRVGASGGQGSDGKSRPLVAAPMLLPLRDEAKPSPPAVARGSRRRGPAVGPASLSGGGSLSRGLTRSAALSSLRPLDA